MGCFVARTVTVLSSYSANAAIDNMEADGRGHIKKKKPHLYLQNNWGEVDMTPGLVCEP